MMILEDITMAEFSRHLKKTKTILIPFGTVEEHGSHLPLNTDTLIICEVLKRIALKRKVFLAPPVHYGVCTNNGQHPGTISIRPATLRSLTSDIVHNSYEKGLRNFYLVSGHGGGLHTAAMKEAAESLVDELDGIKIAVLCPYDILYRELDEMAESENDSHAGEIETSMVLALAPEQVKGRAKRDYPKIPKPLIVRDKVKYWRSGVWGDPEKATKEKGEAAIDLFTETLDKLIGASEKVTL